VPSAVSSDSTGIFYLRTDVTPTVGSSRIRIRRATQHPSAENDLLRLPPGQGRTIAHDAASIEPGATCRQRVPDDANTNETNRLYKHGLPDVMLSMTTAGRKRLRTALLRHQADSERATLWVFSAISFPCISMAAGPEWGRHRRVSSEFCPSETEQAEDTENLAACRSKLTPDRPVAVATSSTFSPQIREHR